MRRIALLLVLTLGYISLIGQATNDSLLVQFSGMVVVEEDGQLIPLPYANVVIRNHNRGTYTNLDGFFSIVGKKGDKVEFTSIGYKDASFVIPDTLVDNRYTIYQIMTQDTLTLPETVVYPWPSRKHFKLEFLAMNVENELEARALENLSERTMRQLMINLPSDGGENAKIYMQQQVNEYVYDGQVKPQNIFNPIAWAKFIQAWKKGDFKKKKKK